MQVKIGLDLHLGASRHTRPAKLEDIMRRWWSVAAAMAIVGGPTSAADLSPGHWRPAERARLERLEQAVFPPSTRSSIGRHEVVSATMSPIAVHVGMEALRQGGTAADAAVAVALTQVATSLGSVVSYAGIAQLTYYDARARRTYVLDAGWGTYAEERDPATIPVPDLSLLTGGRAPPTSGAEGRKTLVPGFMAGMEAANARFGRLSFRDLLAPAIWYAEDGVTVTSLLASYFSLQTRQLSRTEEGRQFLTQAGNASPRAGDRFRQPHVAALLRDVARRGARTMYEGPWAERYVETVRREGGAVRLEDLRRYRPTWGLAVETRYSDATVAGPANAGGCAVLTTLNLLQAADVPSMGPYWEDPKAFATYARAARLAAVADHHPLLASPARPSPCAGRLDPMWAKDVGPRMEPLLSALGPAGGAGNHSAAVVVIDRWGNVAALVHSINTLMWGDTGIVVGGVPIAGAAGVNRARLAAASDGRHVDGDMAPVIAFRAGRPVAAVATIGSSLIPETARMVAGLLDGRGGQALASAPPLIAPFLTGDLAVETIPDGAYRESWTAAVAASRVTLQRESAARISALRGTAAAATIGAGGVRRAEESPAALVFTASR